MGDGVLLGAPKRLGGRWGAEGWGLPAGCLWGTLASGDSLVAGDTGCPGVSGGSGVCLGCPG